MASTLDWDIEIELGEISKPRNSVLLTLNSHFSSLAKSWFFQRQVRTLQTCSRCSSGFLEKMRMSSRYMTMNVSKQSVKIVFIRCWKVARALVKPKCITRKSNDP